MKRLLAALIIYSSIFYNQAADLRISELSNTVLPVATALLPLAQGGTNNNVAVSNLLALTSGYASNVTFNTFFTTNLITTNIFASNVFATNISVRGRLTVNNAFVTNLFTTNNYFQFVTNDFFFNSNSYITNLYVSNAFITNLFVNNNYSTNLFTSNAFITNLYTTNAYITNLFTTNAYITNLFSTFNYFSNTYITNLFSSNAFITNLYTSNIFTTNLFTTNLYSSNIFTTNLFATNIFTTNLFTTNLFSSNAFFTNLFVTNAYITNLTVINTLTNLGLVPNTVLKSDSGGQIVSIPNKLGVLTNDSAGVIDYATSLSMVEVDGGTLVVTNPISVLKITNTFSANIVVTNNLVYITNLNTVVPDFAFGVSRLTTNANFTFLAPAHVTNGVDQTIVVTVTNSSASAIQVTAPANVWVVPNSTMWVTNVTKFTFNQDGYETNVYGIPIK